MTYYSFYSKMQDLCFSAIMLFSLINDDKMKDFYFNANKEYFNKLNDLTKEKAKTKITKTELNEYVKFKKQIEELFIKIDDEVNPCTGKKLCTGYPL